MLPSSINNLVKEKKTFIIIAGMHRSGTSFLARALNLAGVDLGDLESLISNDWKPTLENKRGHWENKQLLQLGKETLKFNKGSWDNPPNNIKINQELGKQIKESMKEIFSDFSLASGFKDPCNVLYLGSWLKKLPKNIVVVGIFRNPLEVAESLRKRNGFKYEKSLELWKTYNQKLLDALKKDDGFLLDFNWPKEKILSELYNIFDKLGLANVDLYEWYTDELITSKKTVDVNYNIPDEVKSLYSKLQEKSKRNDKINIKIIQFTQIELKKIIEDLLNAIQTQGNYFKKINDKNLETIKNINNKLDPISIILAIYYRRGDLQEKYPEVLQGDYKRLVIWILRIHSNEIESEDFVKQNTLKFSSWYQNYIGNEVKSVKLESEVKRVDDLLRTEQVKSVKLESEVKRVDDLLRTEQVKSVKLESEVKRVDDLLRTEQVKSVKLESEVKRVDDLLRTEQVKSVKLESEVKRVDDLLRTEQVKSVKLESEVKRVDDLLRTEQVKSVKLESEVKRVDDLLRTEQVKSVKLESEVKRVDDLLRTEQVKSVKLESEVKRVDDLLRTEQVKSVKLESEVKRVDDLLRTEQVKSVKLESEVKRVDDLLRTEQVKSVKLESEVKELEQNLENIINSQGWKIILKFRDDLNRYFPPNTKRRTILDSVLLPIIKTNSKKKSQNKELQDIKNISSNYAKWKKVTTDILLQNGNIETRKHPKISIIIPIYNNAKVAIPCIESVIMLTTEPYELIIIDDASSEIQLKEYFNSLSKYSNIKIIRNEKNLGYLKSLNNAILNSNNDFVCLNSDTIVTRNWLSKIYSCAYSHKKIGIVAPLSNNASICSVPEYGKPNNIPKGVTLDKFADLVEELSDFKYPPSPTCPGFCIFIKRQLINEIGTFDEIFDPAYGEEDDFCMRAYKHGYLSVIDDSTYIFHHGKSTYSKKTLKLKEEHMKILMKRHPEYIDIVRGFGSENPLKYIQDRIQKTIKTNTEQSTENILIVLHRPIYGKNPGGTELICRMLYEEIKGFTKYVMYTDEEYLVVEEYTSTDSRILFRFKKGKSNYFKSSLTEKEFLINILDELKIRLVHFQHMLYMPTDFFEIVKKMGIKTVLSCRDFYFICPRINLLENGKIDGFCDACQDMDRCDKCLEPLKFKAGFQRNWRNRCQEIINHTDIIITATKSVFELYQQTYSIDAEKFRLVPNGFNIETIKKNIPSKIEHDKLKIGFVGAVMIPHKGRDLILDILEKNNNEKIEWHFFGSNSDPTLLLKSRKIKPQGKVIIHGSYEHTELPEKLNKMGINIVIIPSLETFCNALSEVWAAQIPVIVPNLLALGERVNKSGGGWVYEYPGSDKKILELINKIWKDPHEYKNKVLACQKLKIESNMECLKNHEVIYHELLKNDVL